jgi:hypothetical protein
LKELRVRGFWKARVLGNEWEWVRDSVSLLGE